jgi:hypothetical protein
MKLSDALKSIASARGMTTAIEAVIHAKESLAAGSLRMTNGSPQLARCARGNQTATGMPKRLGILGA